jgi:hypothetical protein
MLGTHAPHTKSCEVCARPFTPARMGQRVCGMTCARKVPKVAKAKERAETKARRRALETIPELIRAAQKEFNAWVRARDEGEPCICCGRRADDKNLLTGSRWDAGHYRSTGSASHLRFNEDNCHRQLVSCNRHGAGRAVDYRIGLIKRIGLERVEALESNNAVHKWTAEELRAIRDKYRAKARELKKGQEE